MTSPFKISWNIEVIDQNALDNEVDYTIFMRTAITGTARVAMGSQSVDIRKCGLLQLSNAMIYLSVMPLLYIPNAREIFLTEAVDMTSVLIHDRIQLSLQSSQYQTTTVFDIDPLEALAEVGRFHAALVQLLYAANNLYRTDSRVREYLSFASVNFLKPR